MTTRIQRRDIPACLREALAAHEALRRLGFRAEDIFVAYHANGIFVELHAQGMEFSVGCGMCEPWITQEKFVELWTRAANAWNDDAQMSSTTRRRIYEESHVRNNGARLVVALVDKGFVFGCGTPPENLLN